MGVSNNSFSKEIQNSTLSMPPAPKVKNKLAIGFYVLLTVFLVAIIFLAYRNYQLKQQLQQKQDITSIPVITPTESKIGSIPVIIYGEEIKHEETFNRRWPTYRLIRKVGDNEPEELVEVGKVGEFPADFVLSPDKKFLLVNFENKLKLLDLETKQLEQLIELEKSNYRGAIFSPDGSQLFIWDQNYVEPEAEREYFVHVFNLKDRTGKIINRGSRDYSLFPLSWRDDDKVVMLEPRGGGPAGLFYYDLKTNELQSVPGREWVGPASKNGRLMGEANSSIGDACNAYSGNAVGSFEIFDPVSGEQFGRVGDDSKVVSIVAFSPDNREIIYTIAALITSPATDEGIEEFFDKCSEQYEKQEKNKLYYRKVISSNQMGVLLEEPQKILASWDAFTVEAKAKWDNYIYSISIGGKVIISSDKPLYMVAQYYQ